MKKIFSFLFFLNLIAIYGFCSKDNIEQIEKNPGTYLNCQDVPIFIEGNPLQGLNAFAVIPPCSIQNIGVNKKIQYIIEKELGTIGKVVKAKSEDMNGFGSGNLLNIQVGKVSTWNEKQIPITRVTLNIETPVVLSKSGKESFPRIWAINAFVDAPFDIGSEEKSIEAIQKLLQEFVSNYQFINSKQKEKPIFYVY
jgi:hypothetical protein